MAFTWQRTSLQAAGSRTDDIWFNDALTGWAVNSDGKVYKTEDGAENWNDQEMFADSYLRCVTFSSDLNGWIGTLSGPHRLYRTQNGGESWIPVTGLPDNAPGRICGLIAVNDEVVFAAGTNYPNENAGVLRTTDGGNLWQVLDLGVEPALLVDIYFTDPLNGWVVGGIDEVNHPDRDTTRRDVIPAVFATRDGGETWTNVVAANAEFGEFPRGEWGWKFQKLSEETFLVSLENFLDGAILRTDDGGASWERLQINDQQRNANLEGIGFIDADHGWVGGWGDLNFQGGYTSETKDGGKNWKNANHVGFRLNRFRFIGNPVTVGYASGDTVYKLSETQGADVGALASSAEPLPAETSDPVKVTLEFDVPKDSETLQIRIWERFGKEVRLLVDETRPVVGPRTIEWDFTTDNGTPLDPGSFVVRVLTGNQSTSRVVHKLKST